MASPSGTVMAQPPQVLPVANNLPAGVRIVPSGDVEAFAEMFLGFAIAMVTGIGSVYLVLLLLFGSAVAAAGDSGRRPVVRCRRLRRACC